MIDQVFARLRDKLVRGVAAVGKAAQADIEESISVPVGRDFAGNAVIRSAPGEPPRRDESQLYGNVESAVFSRPNVIGSVVSSSRPETPSVPQELEFGGVRVAPRPYMAPAMDRFRAGKATAAMKQAMA